MILSISVVGEPNHRSAGEMMCDAIRALSAIPSPMDDRSRDDGAFTFAAFQARLQITDIHGRSPLSPWSRNACGRSQWYTGPVGTAALALPLVETRIKADQFIAEMKKKRDQFESTVKKQAEAAV